jgi:hypothetical protein
MLQVHGPIVTHALAEQSFLFILHLRSKRPHLARTIGLAPLNNLVFPSSIPPPVDRARMTVVCITIEASVTAVRNADAKTVSLQLLRLPEPHRSRDCPELEPTSERARLQRFFPIWVEKCRASQRCRNSGKFNHFHNRVGEPF